MYIYMCVWQCVKSVCACVCVHVRCGGWVDAYMCVCMHVIVHVC